MIHAFHGFLGSPHDLSFLSHNENVVLHDLHLLDDSFHLSLTEDDVLIGYSMGGRLALELAAKAGFKIRKLVLINSHPGPKTFEEKQARIKWEDQILEKMKTQEAHAFLNDWNAQSVFLNDRPLTQLGSKDLKSASVLFDRMRLSKQENFIGKILNHLDKVLWIIGLHDEKYRTLAEQQLIPLGIRCTFVAGGHRLFQQPQEIMQVLKSEGIL